MCTYHYHDRVFYTFMLRYIKCSLPIINVLLLGFKVFRKRLIDRNFSDFFSEKCGIVPIFQKRKKNIFLIFFSNFAA